MNELYISAVLKEIFDILKPFGQSRLVGGCVREMLQDKPPKDIDIATEVVPQKVIELLGNKGFKCLSVGIQHGTVIALKHKHQFEITTLRKDIKCDGRHAEVEFTNDWQIDASRRDFTFNALYMDLEGNLYDFFNGLNDLKNKKVKFIGEPQLRIKEDALRILRYFRFYGYFGGDNIDYDSLNTCLDLAALLKILSGERVWSELKKILSSPFSKEAVQLMRPQVLTEILTQDFDTSSLNFTEDYIINFAALIVKSRINIQSAREVFNRLKLSNIEKKMLLIICYQMQLRNLDDHLSHQKLMYKFGLDFYLHYINLLKVLHKGQTIMNLNKEHMPVFPIKALDLIDLGARKQQIGRGLHKLEKIWLDSNFIAKKNYLLQWFVKNQSNI